MCINVALKLKTGSNRCHVTRSQGVMWLFIWVCEDEYIGESGRTFAERFKEHLKVPLPIYDHCNTTVYATQIDNFSIEGREEPNIARSIKEPFSSMTHPWIEM